MSQQSIDPQQTQDIWQTMRPLRRASIALLLLPSTTPQDVVETLSQAISTAHTEHERVCQLVRDLAQYVRESDGRNGSGVIIHADATIDDLLA